MSSRMYRLTVVNGAMGSAGAQMWQGCKSARGRAAVLSLLQKLGEGYRHLCMYRCNVCPRLHFLRSSCHDGLLLALPGMPEVERDV